MGLFGYSRTDWADAKDQANRQTHIIEQGFPWELGLMAEPRVGEDCFTTGDLARTARGKYADHLDVDPFS